MGRKEAITASSTAGSRFATRILLPHTKLIPTQKNLIPMAQVSAGDQSASARNASTSVKKAMELSLTVAQTSGSSL